MNGSAVCFSVSSVPLWFMFVSSLLGFHRLVDFKRQLAELDAVFLQMNAVQILRRREHQPLLAAASVRSTASVAFPSLRSSWFSFQFNHKATEGTEVLKCTVLPFSSLCPLYLRGSCSCLHFLRFTV